MNKELLNEARGLISSFLKDRRKELGMNQEELANLCGVTRQTIQKIEYGKFMPKMELFLTLTHHLQCYFFLETKEGEGDNAKMMRERWGKRSDN